MVALVISPIVTSQHGTTSTVPGKRGRRECGGLNKSCETPTSLAATSPAVASIIVSTTARHQYSIFVCIILYILQ